MTQEALSYAAQIDRSYLSMLENNKKSPTVDVLFRICEFSVRSVAGSRFSHKDAHVSTEIAPASPSRSAPLPRHYPENSCSWPSM